MNAQHAYEKADKAIGHYQRLLAGHGLTRADKRLFRLLLIRAVFERGAALRTMKCEEYAEAV